MMFDWFERPMFYRRQPSMMSTIYAIQRQRMLQDMFFSDFDFPQLYFVYRTPKKQDKTDDKHDNDKHEEDKSNAQEQQVNTEETPKETKDSMNKEPVPKEENFDESNDAVTDNKDETVATKEEVHNEVNTTETAKPEEVKEEENYYESTEDIEDKTDTNGNQKLQQNTEEIIKTNQEESHDNEEAKEMKEDAQDANEDKKDEVVDNKEENKVSENKKQEKEVEDSNITVETRTTTKKGGFKRAIRKEVNEDTGVVITTEIRSINDQSMTLRRIYYGDGDIEEEESMSHLTKDEIPSFQQKWQEAFSN